MHAIEEASLSRIWQHTKSDKPYALLTAFRPDYTLAQNKKRNQKLAQQIRTLGYGFIYVDGSWEDSETGEHSTETSIFVIGDAGKETPFLKNIVTLGKEYEQDAVLVRTGTTISLYDKEGKSTLRFNKLSPGKVASIYTKLRKSDKTFIFEGTRLSANWLLRLQQRGLDDNL